MSTASGRPAFGVHEMKQYQSLMLCLLLFTAGNAQADKPGGRMGEAEICQAHGGKMDRGDGPAWCNSGGETCRPEMRGRCGKRRGDWYGARQPVADAAEARRLLLNYFAGQNYSVSEVIEKKWGFKAKIHDKNGTVVDRVLIDKRTGRIRSLY